MSPVRNKHFQCDIKRILKNRLLCFMRYFICILFYSEMFFILEAVVTFFIIYINNKIKRSKR